MDSRWKSIPTNGSLQLPAGTQQLLQRLAQHHYASFIVGGCVRDHLLGLTVQDFDVATDAPPQRVIELFPQAILVGFAFGVVRVPTLETPGGVEVATFRQDSEYDDHRRPSKVHYSDAFHDASRRDFTINAFYYDWQQKVIWDAHGGALDLQQRILRAIGDPAQRFQEDALRLLRGVRFQTRFQFEWDPPTWKALTQSVPTLRHVSVERIKQELEGIWAGPHAALGLITLHRGGLLTQLLPELNLGSVDPIPGEIDGPQSVDTLVRTFKLLEKARTPPNLLPNSATEIAVEVFWACILHHLKPTSDAQALLDRLKFSRKQAQIILDHLETFYQLCRYNQLRSAAAIRLAAHPLFAQSLVLFEAMHPVELDAATIEATLESARRQHQDYLNRKPQAERLMTGRDLIHLGLEPGREFNLILNDVEDLTLTGQIRSKEEAVAYVKKTKLPSRTSKNS